MKSFSFVHNLAIVAVLAGLFSAGCSGEKKVIKEDETADQSDVHQQAPKEDGAGSAHNEELDSLDLHWVKLDEQVGDFRITLGHRGNHFHAGESIEPAAQIRKNDAPVTDAVVNVALLAAEGEQVLVEDVASEGVPATETEPAVFAKTTLAIPADTKKFRIRFRIKLPDIEEEKTLTIDVESH